MWDSGEIEGYKYYVKHFEEKSGYGIHRGHISKLFITKDGHDVVIYDRDWVQKPKTEQEKSIYHIVYNMYKKMVRDR